MPDGQARTVTGAVDGGALGRVLTHEHVTNLLPGRYLSGGNHPDELDLVERALSALPEYGYATLVNLTGRSAVGDLSVMPLLAELARRTGLNLICGYGFYTERSFPRGIADMSVEQLTDSFVAAGTEIRGTGVGAGAYGEIASGLDAITDGERRCLMAAARAQCITGLPVFTHASLGTMALEQARILLAEGADPDLVVIGHTDLRPDHDELERILDTGVTIAFDTIGKQYFDYVLRPEESPEPQHLIKRQYFRSDEARLDALTRLVGRGRERQIVLSTDMSGHEAFMNPTTHGRHGYAYLPRVFLPALRERGVRQEAIDTMTTVNPARILAGRTVTSDPTR